MFNYLLSVDRFFNNVYKFINVKFDFFYFIKEWKRRLYIFLKILNDIFIEKIEIYLKYFSKVVYIWDLEGKC